MFMSHTNFFSSYQLTFTGEWNEWYQSHNRSAIKFFWLNVWVLFRLVSYWVSHAQMLLLTYIFVENGSQQRRRNITGRVYWDLSQGRKRCHVISSDIVTLNKPTRKAQLTQRKRRDGGACLKAHFEQNLSSRISALTLNTIIFIHSLAYARWRYRTRAAAVV